MAPITMILIDPEGHFGHWKTF